MLCSFISVESNVIFGVSLLPFFQKNSEELAEKVTNIVDRLVHKTNARAMLYHALIPIIVSWPTFSCEALKTL
jgi:hypothetical protein